MLKMATSSQDSQGETLALETQTFSQVKYYFWVRKVYKFMLHNPFGSISGRRSNYRMSPKVPNRIRCAQLLIMQWLPNAQVKPGEEVQRLLGRLHLRLLHTPALPNQSEQGHDIDKSDKTMLADLDHDEDGDTNLLQSPNPPLKTTSTRTRSCRPVGSRIL